MQSAINGYLIDTGDNLILVDAGAANCIGDTSGKLLTNLKMAGYEPEQVDTVQLTRLHSDHVCGISLNEKAAFPNATVYVSRTEADFWLTNNETVEVTPALQEGKNLSQRVVSPYVAANKLKIYNEGEPLVKGVSVVATLGHTLGHSAYLFTSNGGNLLIWGDIVHNCAIQFARPEVSIELDTDSKLAIETRKKIFQQVADDKLLVGGMHLPFPGLGHARAEKEGYSWVPIEYQPLY